jgi:hypothetical protein
MENYGPAEFLGIFLVGFPALIFLICLLPKGLFWMVEIFFVDDTIKNFFHHHFHYKAK